VGSTVKDRVAFPCFGRVSMWVNCRGVDTHLHPLVYILVVVRRATEPRVSGGLRNKGQCANADCEPHGENLRGVTKLIQHKIADLSEISCKVYT
jgi:hypothetical protein